jgi:hypothetical protein
MSEPQGWQRCSQMLGEQLAYLAAAVPEWITEAIRSDEENRFGMQEELDRRQVLGDPGEGRYG